jgi:hypothetical protein
MPQCAGTKRDGSMCTASVDPPQSYCWWHDPAYADKRQRAASRGGKGKASKEIRDLKKQLEDLADDVLEGRVDRGAAVVVNQIINTRTRLIEIERKVKETEELEARIEALEAQRGVRRLG